MVFAEPSGLAIPKEIRDVVKVAARDAPVDQGSVLQVMSGEEVDPPFLSERQQLTTQQVRGSDAVVVTHADTADGEGMELLEGRVWALSPDVRIVRVDASTGEGVDELVSIWRKEATEGGVRPDGE